MVTKSRRRWRSAVWAVLAFLGMPALGHAQFQLFPHHFHERRERTPSAMESPIYKMTRQQYYGYYAPCWRRFPAGWGCPCPNPDKPAPDIAGRTPARPRDERGSDDDSRRGTGPRPTRDESTLPELPTGPSPFEVDNPKQPLAPPLDSNPDRSGAPTVPRGANAPAPGDGPAMTPPISEASIDPFGSVLPPPPANLPATETTPLLNPGNVSAPIVGTMPGPVTGSPPLYAPLAPVQAPQRRSMLGSLWDRVRR
jgi:hypothetical protein